MKTAINELRTLDDMLDELPNTLDTVELKRCVQVGLEFTVTGKLLLAYKIIKTIKTKLLLII